MKRFSFILLGTALLFSTTMLAQETDKNIFNHLGVGLSVGTDGLPGIDLSTKVTDYVGVRLGYGFMPKFKFKQDVDYTYHGSDYTTEGEFKLNNGTFKMLFDIYPAPKSTSFHVTAGFYAGSSELISLKNTESPIPGIDPVDYGSGGITLGNPEHNKFIGTDLDGNVKGRVKVNGFRPYLGIGFGRSVPNTLCSVNFDLGVQFWGKPKMQVYKFDYIENLDGTITDKSTWIEFTKKDFEETDTYEGDKDVYDILNIAEKISVYPVISLRVGFRCF